MLLKSPCSLPFKYRSPDHRAVTKTYHTRWCRNKLRSCPWAGRSRLLTYPLLFSFALCLCVCRFGSAKSIGSCNQQHPESGDGGKCDTFGDKEEFLPFSQTFLMIGVLTRANKNISPFYLHAFEKREKEREREFFCFLLIRNKNIMLSRERGKCSTTVIARIWISLMKQMKQIITCKAKWKSINRTQLNKRRRRNQIYTLVQIPISC